MEEPGGVWVKKGRKCQRKGRGNKKSEKQHGEHQGERKRKGCSMVLEQIFTVACGEPMPLEMHIAGGTAAPTEIPHWNRGKV